jgi:hypothetical protein
VTAAQANVLLAARADRRAPRAAAAPAPVAGFLDYGRALRERLAALEDALELLAGGNYVLVQQAFDELRAAARWLERESETHLLRFESVFLSAVEYKRPRLRALAGELRSELARFRRQLVLANATGDLRLLPPHGRELTLALRRWIERQENELFPALARELARGDWRELERLWDRGHRPAELARSA